jgi:hypothetical protein
MFIQYKVGGRDAMNYFACGRLLVGSSTRDTVLEKLGLVATEGVCYIRLISHQVYMCALGAIL